MHAADDLDNPDNWIGGHYQLAIELGDPDDSRLADALTNIWRLAGVEGCFGTTGNSSGHEPVQLSLESLQSHWQLHGLVRLPDRKRVVCGIVVTRESEVVAPGFYGPDWVSFFIPLGSLNRAGFGTGGYPFGDYESSLAWRQPLDEWLADVGRQLFDYVAYRFGLVGMEVAGDAHSDRMDSGVPADRPFGWLVPGSAGVHYHPATV